MKKLLSLSLVLILLVLSLAACGSETPPTVRVGGLTGPTSIGMAKLMADNEAGTTQNTYDFTVAGSADVLTPMLIKGELDIAAVPANLAAVLYQRTNGAVQILAINTLGVQYIVEKGGETVSSFADLRGKTLYATGKGTVNEYSLRYLLKQAGLDPDQDVTVEWKSEPTEVVALLKQNASAVAMLPQPYVTVAQGAVEGLGVALSLSDTWDSLDNGSRMITGTLVVRREFAEKNPETVRRFLAEYRASTEYVVENPNEAAPLVEQYVGIKAGVAKTAIPFCNITCITGEDMIQPLSSYLTILYGENPAAVGGALPLDDFYYVQASAQE